MSTQRQPGYYHIKHFGEWVIAKWEQCKYDSTEGCIKGLFMWHYTCDSTIIITDIVDEINETRIPEPGEKDVNYETLLEKYIKHVSEAEGVDFIDRVNTGYASDVIFTPEEVEVLNELK